MLSAGSRYEKGAQRDQGNAGCVAYGQPGTCEPVKASS